MSLSSLHVGQRTVGAHLSAAKGCGRLVVFQWMQVYAEVLQLLEQFTCMLVLTLAVRWH